MRAESLRSIPHSRSTPVDTQVSNLSTPTIDTCTFYKDIGRFPLILSCQKECVAQSPLYRVIMASRAGPVPIHLTRTPVCPSINSMYFLQFSGRAWNDLMPVVSVFQPGKVL